MAEIGERLLCCKAVGPGPYGCHTAVTQIDNFGYMDEQYAIDGLAALLQTTRLKAFRLLVSHEPGGVAAGEIARAMDVPQNTMWARHLDALRTGSERAAIALDHLPGEPGELPRAHSVSAAGLLRRQIRRLQAYSC